MSHVVNLYFLTHITDNDDDLLAFCKDIKLIPAHVKCPCCRKKLCKPYLLKRSTSMLFQEIRYQCNRLLCKKSHKPNSVSIRKYTWFESSKLTIQKSLFLTYCFVYQMSYKDTIRETSINIKSDNTGYKSQQMTSSETVSDYKRYCRDVCANVVLDNSSQQIGGPGLTVEIDESKFGKMKYNKGRKVDGKWVFGGICRETKEIFVVPVDRRSKDNLLPIIKDRIRPGTTIISDCWSSYKCLNSEGFKHLTVNHTYNFVDPDTLAHTQNIENMWWQIKRQLPDTHSRHEQLYLHMSEFMWRNLRKDSEDIFVAFLKDISFYYPGKVRSLVV